MFLQVQNLSKFVDYMFLNDVHDDQLSLFKPLRTSLATVISRLGLSDLDLGLAGRHDRAGSRGRLACCGRGPP